MKSAHLFAMTRVVAMTQLGKATLLLPSIASPNIVLPS